MSVPSAQTGSPVYTNVALTNLQLTRAEQSPKHLRTNRPTVNSLMHLYGPWILDACLLQIKDRFTRSATIVNVNDGELSLFVIISFNNDILCSYSND